VPFFRVYVTDGLFGVMFVIRGQRWLPDCISIFKFRLPFKAIARLKSIDDFYR